MSETLNPVSGAATSIILGVAIIAFTALAAALLPLVPASWRPLAGLAVIAYAFAFGVAVKVASLESSGS